MRYFATDVFQDWIELLSAGSTLWVKCEISVCAVLRYIQVQVSSTSLFKEHIHVESS